MSRNADRIGNQQGILENVKKPEKEFFTLPVGYNVVFLPTQGRFYPPEHPWHNKDSIEMREITTKHEEILSNKQLIAKGTALDKVIADLFVDEGINVDNIFLVDKNAIILDVMKNNYQKEYKVSLRCPECGEKKTETINLDETERKPLPDSEELPSELRVPIDVDGSFSIQLKDKNDKPVATLSVRLLRGEDEKSLKIEEEKKKKHNFKFRPIASLLQKIIVAINDDDDPLQIQKFVEDLPSFYSQQIQREYKRLAPTVELNHEFVCSCKFSGMIEVPLNAESFRPIH